jgi:hypothetical protein
MIHRTTHLDQRKATLRHFSNAFLKGLIAFTVVSLMTLGGCSEGKRPIATARMCLPNSDDVAEFVTLLRETGQSNRMTFFDRTSETRVDLRALGSPNGTVGSDGFILNVGIRRPDGMGVTASQLAGPGLQVALGFSKAEDPAEANRFAAAVIDKLKRRWRVELFPDGAGVQPFDHCP